ncbi:hypothetical protein SUGI_0247730 [Cryptomeria japonica]|uniref:WRKY transcription factor 71-like n=1 Tax=Cryptomeria japonica TaxID=3369 RepID=UPI002408DABD|nr:WRKY transcription factor 71-like [Cryptomeria japonica]GLJ15142.1 hypothetical protein SUGI_0247730 [Cryptomeria japonica]
MADTGFYGRFHFDDGEISSPALQFFNNSEGTDFCMPKNKTHLSDLDVIEQPLAYPCQNSYPSQSLSSSDYIESCSFLSQKSAEYEELEKFEGKQSDDPPYNHSGMKRTNIDEDGLQCTNKRYEFTDNLILRLCLKNVDGKSSQIIIIQVRSEEPLDDGYKWRKYGEKSMPNCEMPRCYYKCSDKKCSVKKRVERNALEDEIVVVTYEGIHNHPFPNPVCYVERRVYLPMPCAATCQ